MEPEISKSITQKARASELHSEETWNHNQKRKLRASKAKKSILTHYHKKVSQKDSN